MQGMLDNLSQPVAFATVPLGVEAIPGPSSPRRDSSLSSDTESEEPIVSRLTRKLGMGRTTSAMQSKTLSRSLKSPIGSELELEDDDFFDEGNLGLSKSYSKAIVDIHWTIRRRSIGLILRYTV